MKILIASDIHGSAYYCRKLLDAYRAEGAEMLLLLGDVLYHGPRNDLPEEYAPKTVIPMLNALGNKIICVRGNCDTEVDQMVLDFPLLSDYSYIMADGLCIFATHGHKYSEKNPPKLKAGDILLCGHTHIPAAEEFGERNWYLNPGSVSIPKNDSERGYILYENREFTFRTLDGAVYDVLDLK